MKLIISLFAVTLLGQIGPGQYPQNAGSGGSCSTLGGVLSGTCTTATFTAPNAANGPVVLDGSGNASFPGNVSTLGNVGIGTASPVAKLEVSNTGANRTAYGIVIDGDNGSTNSSAAGFILNDTSSTPNGKLSFISRNNTFNINQENSPYGSLFLVSSINGNTAIGLNNNNLTSTLSVKDASTTGTTQLLVQGGSSAGDATTNQLFRINQGGGTTGLMVVQGNGNVGIGTTSPGAKLDVTGNASAIVARFYDQTASTGLTKVTVQDGAGQSTTPSLRITNNAGTAFSVAARGAIGTGIILTDSAGACWNIVPAVSTGVLTSTTITCPTVP